jgi:hypothetical protein
VNLFTNELKDYREKNDEYHVSLRPGNLFSVLGIGDEFKPWFVKDEDLPAFDVDDVFLFQG